jgi:predicted nucleic acid-binding protein
VLVDSGPLIALFDASDRHHGRVLRFLSGFRHGLLTTWPVLTEVCHLLRFSVDAQLDFLRWVERGGVEIAQIENPAIARIIALTEKCRDRPMDLADASLVVLALATGVRKILSLDSDFDIYRLPDRGRLVNLLK